MFQCVLVRKSTAFIIGFAVTLLIGGCASMEGHEGKTIGTVAGAAAGCLIAELAGGKCAKGAAIGGLAGLGLGAIYDYRQKAIQEAAAKNNIPVEFKKVTTQNRQTATSGAKTTKNTAKPNGMVTEVHDPMLFDIGSSQLNPRARKAFTDIAKAYAKDGQKIMIVGHTDSSGESNYNQRLSERRAKSVADVFVAAGIGAKNLYYQGVGESQPVASNTSANGRARNRRVEILEIDSEESVANYAYEQRSNPEFLSHQVAQTTQSKASKPASPGSRNNKIAVVDPSVIDFGGVPANQGDNNLYAEMGEELHRSSGFFISEAKAEVPQGHISCVNDEYRISGNVISMDSGKPLEGYKSSEYMPGLYGTSWSHKVNGHLVGLTGVRVLRNGDVPAANPRVLVWKNYDNPKQKPSFKTTAKVNAYEGEKGILYRMFLSQAPGPISCLDIVFPRSAPFVAKTGHLYYDLNSRAYQADYRPKIARH